MGYVGNEPLVNFTSFAKQDITGDGGANYTLTHAVANANEIEVFVNNVRQEPTDAYSVSGTALTMTGNVASSDNFYVVYLGKAIQTTVPPDGSVSTAKIADSAVTNAKIANTTIDITSKVTGVLPVANSQTNTPSFEAYLGSQQTISHLTDTKVQFNTEVFDSDNKYDNSTNYRFTPTVAGKYHVYANIGVKVGSFEIQQHNVKIALNGSDYRTVQMYVQPSEMSIHSNYVSATMDLDADDYVEIFTTVRQTGSGTMYISADSKVSYFGAYKLIGA